MTAVHVPLGGRDSARCVEEAEEAVKELRAALANAGIKLPSLRLDPASLAREAPCPLVELGGCSVDVAARLTAALRTQRDPEVG
ncbi:hypothetical protein Q2K21_28800 [Streptomyces sp. CGMCC 4.7035]|nr:hypothetical protein [Streptomyces sp. CGMCC 4.7035]WNC01740.1 hypothetical protein Q2K21_28800 [Streptomyces sp. CGMCC 4.7035]